MMTTRPTVNEVVGKLTALGSADHIALFFAAEGIRGDLCESFSCPIAAYIARESCWRVSATRYEIVPTQVAGLERALDLVGMSPPLSIRIDDLGPVGMFMSRFDAGRYPELEA